MKSTIDELRTVWEEFSEVPIDDNDKIKRKFLHFPPGTYRFEVWQWFDERCPNGLVKDILKKKARKSKKTKKISLGTKSPKDQIYKVRAAITLAHYLFVEASSHDEAERKIEEYIRDIEKNQGGYDWYGEASHMHTTFEGEEAE